MSENGEERKGGGKGRLLAVLALVGAAVAFLMFWRRRHSDGEDEDEVEVEG